MLIYTYTHTQSALTSRQRLPIFLQSFFLICWTVHIPVVILEVTIRWLWFPLPPRKHTFSLENWREKPSDELQTFFQVEQEEGGRGRVSSGRTAISLGSLSFRCPQEFYSLHSVMHSIQIPSTWLMCLSQKGPNQNEIRTFHSQSGNK